MDADDARVGIPQALVIEAQGGGQIAAEVVGDGIGAGCQALQDFATAGVLQVQREAALVAAEGLEKEAVAPLGIGQDVAAHLAAGAVVLDLDHVGAEIGQIHGAERRRAVLLDREDDEPPQGPEGRRLVRWLGRRRGRGRRGGVAAAHAGLRSTSWRAMTIRWISLVPSPMQSSGASRYMRSMGNSLE